MGEMAGTNKITSNIKRPKPGPGRPKGSPNKINADVKSMVLGALSDVGGKDYLARQAEQNPAAFMTLVGKVLPMQVTGADGGPVLISRVERIIVRPEHSDS